MGTAPSARVGATLARSCKDLDIRGEPGPVSRYSAAAWPIGSTTYFQDARQALGISTSISRIGPPTLIVIGSRSRATGTSTASAAAPEPSRCPSTPRGPACARARYCMAHGRVLQPMRRIRLLRIGVAQLQGHLAAGHGGRADILPAALRKQAGSSEPVSATKLPSRVACSEHMQVAHMHAAARADHHRVAGQLLKRAPSGAAGCVRCKDAPAPRQLPARCARSARTGRCAHRGPGSPDSARPLSSTEVLDCGQPSDCAITPTPAGRRLLRQSTPAVPAPAAPT